MELILTKEQFRTLVKLAFLGDWVANSHRLGDDCIKKYSEMEQYLWNQAKKKGFDDLAELEPTLKKALPTAELEEEMHELIHDHDETIFWDDLADKMAVRDLVREHGEKGLRRMAREKYFALICRREETYMKEFEKNGLDRLEIEALKEKK